MSRLTATSTFDTTAGFVANTAIYCYGGGQRTAGANAVRNYGILAEAALGQYNYAGYFCVPNVTSNGGGPICIQAYSSASAPTHSADKGTLWVTSVGILYINTNGSTTWEKVGAQ